MKKTIKEKLPLLFDYGFWAMIGEGCILLMSFLGLLYLFGAGLLGVIKK